MASTNGNHYIDLTLSDGEKNEDQRMCQNPAKSIPQPSKDNGTASSAARPHIRPAASPNFDSSSGPGERPSHNHATKNSQQTTLSQSKSNFAGRRSKTPTSSFSRNQSGRFESGDSTKRNNSPSQSSSYETTPKSVVEKLKKRAPEGQLTARMAIASKKKEGTQSAPTYGSPYGPISNAKPASLPAQPSDEHIIAEGRERNLISHPRVLGENRPTNAQLHPARQGMGNGKDSTSMANGERLFLQQGHRGPGGNESRRNSLTATSTSNFSSMLRSLISDSTKINQRGSQIAQQTKLVTVKEKPPLIDAPEFDTVSEVQPIYVKHREAFMANHQYLIKSWLPRARVDNSKEFASKLGRNASQASAEKPRSAFENMRDIGSAQKPKTPASGDFISTTDSAFLNGLRTPSVTNAKFTPTTRYSVPPVKIPLYTSHTTLRHNILAENIKKLAVWPHFSQVDEDNAEQDLYPELKERYSHGNPDNRKGTLLLREQAKQLGYYVERFLDDLGCTTEDVLRYFLDATGNNLPRAEREEVLNSNWNEIEENDQKKAQLKVRWETAAVELFATKASEQRQQNAKLACEAFTVCEGFSLWHVVKHLYDTRKPQPVVENDQERRLAVYKSLECLVCHVHDCDFHGEIREKGMLSDFDDDDAPPDNSSDDDDSTNINNKIRVVTRQAQHKQAPTRLAYDLSDGSTDANAYAGRNRDGSVSGFYNEMAGEQTSFEDDQLCSEACFWLKTNRGKLQALSAWNPEDSRVFEGVFAACGHNKRGPCMIAKIMSKSCVEVFLRALAASSRYQHDQQPERHKKATVKKKGVENSIIHNREPFIPCHHAGTCKQARCRCFTRGTHCEKTCACPPNCDRRFKGCNCARIGMVCWQNKKCLCFLMNRECDEDLCKTCGADEVLDPANRHNFDITTGRCTNVGIQRNLPKRTLLGSSEVNGFGLFVGEPIKKHEFIAEYRGEIISSEESNRRGAIYDWRPANYLFKLNKSQDIDATHAGNKTRFINNSSNDMNKNCEPALLLCNTVTRIGIYALRDIAPGEELFFNYGYPASKMEKFLEKSQHNGNTVLVKAKAPKLGGQGQRMRRKANAESGTLSGDKQLAKSLSRKDGTTENGPDDVAMSDDNEEAEYAAEAELRKLVGGDASSDDDYEDEAAQSSSSQSDEEGISASRARRNLRSRKRRSISPGSEDRAMKMARTAS